MRLQTRLAIMVSLLAGSIAAFIFVYFPARLEQQALDAVGAKAHSIGAMTAFSISPALVFGDSEAVQEGFQGALRNRDLAYLVAVDRGGRIVDAVNQTPLSVEDLIREGRAHYEGAGIRRLLPGGLSHQQPGGRAAGYALSRPVAGRGGGGGGRVPQGDRAREPRRLSRRRARGDRPQHDGDPPAHHDRADRRAHRRTAT